jgi:hypothetical protein
LVQELTTLTGYLSTAAAVLPQQDPWRVQMETMRSEWRAKLMDPSARAAADFRQKINRALQRVKDEYRTTYLNLHKKARLGANEDTKKKELLKDARLESLKKLAGVSLLSHSALSELQSKLARVQTCFSLIKDNLDSTPICPHCHFRPLDESSGAGGTVVLGQIDQQLDDLLENWTKTLLENLDDPTAKKSVKLLPPEQKDPVNAFLKSKELPATISNELVQGMQQALSGLVAISLKTGELMTALSGGGAPCTIEQLQSRFREFVEKKTHGKDAAKVRLVIEGGEMHGEPS